jgi:hypothetical protein
LLIFENLQITSAVNKNVPVRDACFNLLGFDIMLDATLKPWLLEVNGSPSLQSDSPLDYRVKSRICADLLNMIGLRRNESNRSSPSSVHSSTATNPARYRTSSPSHWLRGRNRQDGSTLLSILEAESNREYERCGRWHRIFPTIRGMVHNKSLFGKTRDVNQYMCDQLEPKQKQDPF